MKEILSHSIADTAKFAQEFLAGLFPCADSSTVVGLYGDLGSGKTAFVQQIAKALGARGSVQSPTFVIMKLYEIKLKAVPWKKLVHIDAYRLERAEDLEALRFEEIIADKNNLVIVEWPEQVELQKFGERERLVFEMKDGVCVIVRKAW